MKGWTAETKSAIEAVTFIAAHLKNEDDYAEVTFFIIIDIYSNLGQLPIIGV